MAVDGNRIQSEGNSDAEYAGIINQPFLREIFSLPKMHKRFVTRRLCVVSGPQRGKKRRRKRQWRGFFDGRRMLLCDRNCGGGGLAVWMKRHTALLLSQLDRVA